MEFWTALILGLAGSAHCAGMCGPLALALPAVGATAAARVGGRLLYNLGRVVTYCLLGLIFGVVGKTLALAGVQRWVSIALGAGILLALVLARPQLLDAPFGRPVARLKSSLGPLLRRRSYGSLAVLGLLNGLLPCGLVYVACAGAVAVGSMLGGIKYMLVFGLGTVPMMLALGLAGSVLPLSIRLKFQKAVPVCLALVGALLILRGLSLGIPYLSPDLSAGSCCLHGH